VEIYVILPNKIGNEKNEESLKSFIFLDVTSASLLLQHFLILTPNFASPNKTHQKS
jgi:hypothetical protein